MRKYEIASMLAKKFEYTSYLEIVTPSTGGTYAEVDTQRFPMRRRLMYLRPPDFTDGEPIDFSTETGSAEDLYCDLMSCGARFDLVFVDPFHTYASSLRDIVYALRLVKDDGMVLIHDCDPPREEVAGPEYREGEWCGVTYAAYLDVVLFDKQLRYVTVDADYGCGIISKRSRPEVFRSQADKALASNWRGLGLTQKFTFFHENRTALLHLISPDGFVRLLRPWWQRASTPNQGE